ncbi:MAG TPA: LamG domain-containing protein [Bacteroidia bacterium]|nr:LamG domain-containing protein [Bacteroidia bacterium]
MKTLYFSVLILLLSSINTLSQINLNNGLIACYPFSGNALDQSGNNHNGTVVGPTLVNDRFGNTNSAYSYNGVNNYINLGIMSPFTLSNTMSLSVWIQPNQVKLQTILMLQPDDFNDRFNAMAYYSHNGTSSTVWDFGNCVMGGRLMQVGTIFSPAWQHFVYTVNPVTGMKVYKDGVLVNTQSTSSPLVNRQKSLWIGGGIDINGALFYFDGIIDDMRIYDRELTPAEVQTLYGLELMCTPTAIADLPGKESPYSVKSVNGKLIITSRPFSDPANLQILSGDGRSIYLKESIKGGETITIPFDHAGILLYTFSTAKQLFAGKIAALFLNLLCKRVLDFSA